MHPHHPSLPHPLQPLRPTIMMDCHTHWNISSSWAVRSTHTRSSYSPSSPSHFFSSSSSSHPQNNPPIKCPSSAPTCFSNGKPVALAITFGNHSWEAISASLLEVNWLCEAQRHLCENHAVPDRLREYWHKHTNQLLLVLFQVRFKKCAPTNIPVILGTLLIALLHRQHQLKQCALVHVECREYEVDPVTQHSCCPWCSVCLVTPAPTRTPHTYTPLLPTGDAGSASKPLSCSGYQRLDRR